MIKINAANRLRSSTRGETGNAVALVRDLLLADYPDSDVGYCSTPDGYNMSVHGYGSWSDSKSDQISESDADKIRNTLEQVASKYQDLDLTWETKHDNWILIFIS